MGTCSRLVVPTTGRAQGLHTRIASTSPRRTSGVLFTHPQHAVKQVPRHAIVEAQLPLQTSREEGGEGGEGAGGGGECIMRTCRRAAAAAARTCGSNLCPPGAPQQFVHGSESFRSACCCGSWRPVGLQEPRPSWLALRVALGGGPASPASKDEMQVEKAFPGARI